jgi:carbonic anhydrase
MDTREAIKRLVDGNLRFATGHVAQKPPIDVVRTRWALRETQTPFAIIVGCSDSRVSPELLFDTELGELFDIRTAGHTIDHIALGSIQYGVEHLKIGLIVVMAHERCGAVTAAVEGGATGYIEAVADEIASAVEQTKDQPGDHVDNAARQNARNVAHALYTDPLINPNGDVTVLATRYDLDTGLVVVLSDA